MERTDVPMERTDVPMERTDVPMERTDVPIEENNGTDVPMEKANVTIDENNDEDSEFFSVTEDDEEPEPVIEDGEGPEPVIKNGEEPEPVIEDGEGPEPVIKNGKKPKKVILDKLGNDSSEMWKLIRKILLYNINKSDIPKSIVGIIMVNLIYAIGIFIKNLDKNKPISKTLIKTGLIATITTAISTISTAIAIYMRQQKGKGSTISNQSGGIVPAAEIINIITIALLDNYFIDDLTDIIYNALVAKGYLTEDAKKIVSNNPTLKHNAIARPMDYVTGKKQTNVINTAIHDLARLKQKISAPDATNPNGIFSPNGVGATWNMKFPFHPALWSGMHGGFKQTGGGTTLWDIEQIVKTRDTESGLISQMYTNIVDFLDTNQIQLSKKSKSQIEDKLTKFKTAELELNKALEEAVNRVKILKNTNGRIDIDKASNEEERQKLVEIYSDIPRLIGNTNKLSATMMGIFQSMLQAAADANKLR